MAVCTGAAVFCRSICASMGANCFVPVSTRTSPSSVSKAVAPENCDWNQVRGATSTGPPVQKNFASSGVFPRMLANLAAGFSVICFPLKNLRFAHANPSAPGFDTGSRMPNRPTLHVKPREGRRARAGAPWIFSNEIVMDAKAKALAPGSLVNVQADEHRLFGVGYFNPKTLIAVRLFEAPAETAIDKPFLAARLERALRIRKAFFEKPHYRLVHAEGDGLPGLIVDRFGGTLVVQIATAGMEALLEPLLEALDDVVSPDAIVLRADAAARALEGLDSYVRFTRGEEVARVRLEESGAQYFADVESGQKTGWYFDQRDNRAFMANLAMNKSVLDAYCYTGGFAIQAARSGAKEAIGLDSSQPALFLAEEAATANG